MLKAAVYARFSTDLQNERSIDDQLELCRTFANNQSLNPVLTFEDRAQSGASIVGRNGIARLMRAAQEGQYQVLVVEALDRLSRDQEDLAHIWKRLSFLGIEIRAVHDGTADAVQIGIRGLLGSLFLTDLANKVRRGMDGVIRDGRHAGGRAYGYRPVLVDSPRQKSLVEGFPSALFCATVLDAYRNIIHGFIGRPQTA